MYWGQLIIKPFRGKLSQKALQDLKYEITENMQMNDNVATGRMLRSVHVRGDALIIEVPYAVYVEYGTSKHLAPIKPLVKWARAKFGVGNKEAWAIAKRVQKKIAVVGTKPSMFIRHALEDLGYEIVDRYLSNEFTVLLIRKKTRMRITEKRV